MGVAVLYQSYGYRIVRLEPLSLRERGWGEGSARTADESKVAVSDG